MLQTKASPSCFLGDPTGMTLREGNWVWGISHDQAAVDGCASGWGTTQGELRDPDRDRQEQRSSNGWGRVPHQRRKEGDFPARPVVKTVLPTQGGQGSIPE